ncbi:MAG TPA: hypothetical protein VNW29_05375, partial [Candidatus Sulfotelmatobacter sp.]|nr:hypothetical protein [Candidatus Sulfotelmatobacter sp.]
MLFKKHFYYKKHLTYLFVSLFFLVISASPVYASELFSNTTFTSNLSSWDIGEMPTDLAAVQAWFRSDQITGVSDGGSVNSWTDLSGNGYTATQSATSQQPVYKANMLNGQPTVHFNGSQYLQLLPASLGIANSTGGLSLFAVIKSASATQRVVSLSTPTGTDRAVMGRTNGSAFMADGKRLDSDSTQTLSGGTYTTNNFSVDDAIFNYSSRNLNIFSSGTSQATTTTFQTVGNTSATNSKSILIGSDNTNGLNGDIAEVIIVNSALSTADRANIETYLGNRYGLTVTSASISATRTNTFTYNGNAMSAKVVTTGTANFTQMVNVGDTNTYTLTAYVHNATGKAITANDVQLFAQGSSVSTIYTPQANGWYQLTGSVTGLSSLSDY